MPQVDYDSLAQQLGGSGEAQEDQYDTLAKSLGSKLATPKAIAIPGIAERHAANLSAEESAYKPGWSDVWQGKAGGTGGWVGITREMAKDVGSAITETPERIGGMIAGVPKLLYEAVTRPAAFGVDAVPEIIKSTTEPLISPRTTGKAVASGAIDTALLAGAGKAIGAGASAVRGIPARHLQRGTNQIIAGLRPNARTAKSLESTQGHFQDFIGRSGRKIKDADSGAAVFNDAAQEFMNVNYKPLADEIRKVPINHQGQIVDADWLFNRRAELNDTLGRLGYYDKNPMVKSFARSSPGVQQVLDEVEAVRGSLNTAVDTLTPTNAGAANILRTYADMKQVADMSKIRAERVKLAKQVKAGEATPALEYVGQLVKDTALTFGTLGVKPLLAIRWARMIAKDFSKKAPDADALFNRGAKNWQRGKKAAAQPIPVKKTPIKFPDEPLDGTPTGQAEMPFVPPGVGAMGSELPLQPGAPRAIQVPNDLTRQFNRPLSQADDINRPDPTTGQTQLPFVPPQVGEIPGTLLPPENPTSRAFWETSQGQRTPTQLALPPAHSIQLGPGTKPRIRVRAGPAPVISPAPSPKPQTGGINQPHKLAADPARNYLQQAGVRMEQEQAGQFILDSLEGAGRTPQHVVSDFWQSTYSKLPEAGRQRMERYLHKMTGTKPGDVIAVNREGRSIRANSWQDIYPTAETSEVRHLEGVERGLISLMEMANQMVAKSAPKISPVPNPRP